MESANKDVGHIQGKPAPSVTTEVNKLNSQGGKKKKKKFENSEGANAPQSAKSMPSQKKACYRCNRTNHNHENCRFKNATCHGCGKKGHILPACKLKSKDKVHTLNVDSSHEEYLKTLSENDRNVIWVSPKINGTHIDMELDTGSGVSVIPKSDFENYFKGCKLEETNLTLKTYSGEPIKTKGYIETKVELNNQEEILKLYVLDNKGRPLFGREWLRKLNLNWSEIKTLHVSSMSNVSRQSEVANVKLKYADVFSDGLGKLKEVKAK